MSVQNKVLFLLSSLLFCIYRHGVSHFSLLINFNIYIEPPFKGSAIIQMKLSETIFCIYKTKVKNNRGVLNDF
jgi:hypothetical protein